MSEPTTTTTTPAQTHNLLEALLLARQAMTNDRYSLPRQGMEEAWTAADGIITVLQNTRLIDREPQNISAIAMELHGAGVLLLDLERDLSNSRAVSKRWYDADQATREALGQFGITLLPESEEAADGVRHLAGEKVELEALLDAIAKTLDPVKPPRRNEIGAMLVVRLSTLTSVKNECAGEAHTLADLLSEAAKRLGLNPTSFEPPHILQMIDRWRMDLDQMQKVETLLRSKTTGRIYGSTPARPTLLDIANEAMADLDAARFARDQARQSAGTFQAQARVREDERNAAQKLLDGHRTERGELELLLDGAGIAEGTLPARIRELISRNASAVDTVAQIDVAAGDRATGDSLVAHVRKLRHDLEAVRLERAQCHDLLTLRGGPIKDLRTRISDILDDRDNRATRMGEIQAELDTQAGTLRMAKAAAERLEIDRDNHAEAIKLTMEQKRELERRIEAALRSLECYMPRRGSMVEKAIKALTAGAPLPDRTREPIFPVLEALWDDEAHHPTPAIRQDAIDAEDRRILASAGQPLNRQ